MRIGPANWLADLLLLLRRGLPALAVYAMLLQAFLAVAAPAAAFDPAGQPICAGLATGNGDAGRTGPAGGTHGCICLASCAHLGHAGPPATAPVVFIVRNALPLVASPPARESLVVEAPVFPGLGPRAPPRA